MKFLKKLVILYQKLTGVFDYTDEWVKWAREVGKTRVVVIWDSFELEEFACFCDESDVERIVGAYNNHPTTNVSGVLLVA